MKTTRTYSVGCLWCNATGRVSATGLSTTVYEVCPVCNGAKTIPVTEITEDSYYHAIEDRSHEIKINDGMDD